VHVEFCTEEGKKRYAFLKVHVAALHEINKARMHQ